MDWAHIHTVTRQTTVSLAFCVAASGCKAADDPARECSTPGADPHAIFVGETLFVVGTAPSTAPGKNGTALFAYETKDGSEWSETGPLITFDGIEWINDDGAPRHYLWAPALLAATDRYILYYSVGPQNPTPSRIGAAVSENIAGPYKDVGEPLITGDQSFEAIDPTAFHDPISDQTYLYAGGSAGATLRAWRLADDLVSLAGEARIATPLHFTEAPFMHLRDDTYYLSYSHGRWDDNTYSVHYATGDSPTGPWTYQGEILSGGAKMKGPGHHSFIEHPASGETLIVFHYWNAEGVGPYTGDRRIGVRRIEYNGAGEILPINLDDRSPTTVCPL